MHISLTPELERRVKSRVESGLYNNASEVIREALRFMDSHEEWIRAVKTAQLKQQINVGIEQLDQGQGLLIESKQALDDLFDSLKQK